VLLYLSGPLCVLFETMVLFALVLAKAEGGCYHTLPLEKGLQQTYGTSSMKSAWDSTKGKGIVDRDGKCACTHLLWGRACEALHEVTVGLCVCTSVFMWMFDQSFFDG
jgi:hypothetical protein